MNLSSKLEPMLERVENAQKNIEMARATNLGSLSQTQTGGIGMLSKMGGRMMHFYSDDLAEMLLDDILVDTVQELQVVEHKQRQSHAASESRHLAENLMKHIVDYQSEENLVHTRWVSN